MKNLNLFILFFLISSLMCFSAKAQTTYQLTIEFSQIDNNKGVVWAAVYNNKDQWMKKELQGKSAAISNNTSTLTFDLPAGTYAISAFHDENNNKKLDTNMLGIPKEGYGFSNNPNAMFGPPSYSKASFQLNANTTIQIKL